MYPSEKCESQSVGKIIPNIWKNEIHVPNHQPDLSYPPEIQQFAIENGH